MKLSEVKSALSNLEKVNFQLPNGTFLPEYFHVTEVGIITKDFIDCGGTVRSEKVVNFQLWEDDQDADHRLSSARFLDIIQLSEKTLGIQDAEIEVEYQSETIGKFGLEFNGTDFQLTNKQTACLALDKCGIPAQKPKIRLSADGSMSCTPGSGCC